MTVLMIVAIDELMLSVRTESPYKTIEDFVDAARAKPGQLTVGGTGTHNEDHIFAHLLEQAAKIKLKYVPFNSGGEVTAALMGGHIDAGIMNPNEIVAQVEAGKAKNLAVAAQEAHGRRARRPDLRREGLPVLLGADARRRRPGRHGARGGRWWQDTLKKVTATKKWQDDYIKGNLLTPTTWTGEEANKYLDGITGDYEKRARRSRRPEEVGRARRPPCAAPTGSPAPPCSRWPSRSAPAR